MKNLNILGVLVLCLTIGVSACQKSNTKQKADNDVPKVKIETTSMKSFDQYYEVTANVLPDVKNSIAPAAPGRIRHILVEVGQYVHKGQKLVQMDVANLSNLETQIENQKRIYNRAKELFSVGGASQQDLDNAKVQLDVAQTNLKNMGENTYLLSPISGVITARNYDNGDMYSGQTPVLIVMSINPVKVVVGVSESYYAQIKTGMPANIQFDVLNGQTFTGRVSLIYPTIDERTRTFSVEIKLANAANKIRPGMFGRVRLEFGKKDNVVVHDVSIVKQVGSGERFVFVYQNGKVEQREVQLGRREGSDYEVISGLKPDEQVVVAGQSKLIDGMKVELIK